MPRGGARPGAGKPKGCKHKKTIERELALKIYEDKIKKDLEDFILSQFTIAKGISVMFQRRKIKDKKGEYHRTGEFVRVRDEKEIEKLLNSGCMGDDWYYITTKDPNVHALDSIFNRIFGKPKESMELSGPGGKPIPMPANLTAVIKKFYGGKKDNSD